MAAPGLRMLFVLGVAFMVVALLLQNVTLAGGRYGVTLLAALGLAAAADACFVGVAWRGRGGWRVAAVVGALPTLFVVADFVRRAPDAF